MKRLPLRGIKARPCSDNIRFLSENAIRFLNYH